MATPKIVLNASRDIPFNTLVLSQANVRKVKAGVSIEELAEDIARRTLLHSLAVRPVLDAEGAETGVFEVPVGGRRFRALELLVKQKRMTRTQPVPCIVRTGGLAEEDSLAENLQREPLHPLDQFRAFQTLREAGLGEEEIAARFFVGAGVVKQRLKLATVAAPLLDAYADDKMTLEQLMAFTVTDDQARQEQVWEALSRAVSREPYQIRRLLTEGAVRASDKRALFVGIEAYEAAGGAVMRDLFQHDDGGWLQDPALLDRMVTEKLEAVVTAVQAEGWRWVEAALGFPYGHGRALRRLAGEPVPLTEAEQATYDALHAEYERLESTDPADAGELDAAAQRLVEIDVALRALEDRPAVYETAEVARAGVFVSVGPDGQLQIDRGYVRPEDEAPVEPVPVPVSDPVASTPPMNGESGTVAAQPAAIAGGSRVSAPAPVSTGGPESPEAEELRPLPDRLLTELSVHRTLALRDAVASDPDIAFLAALHALCLRTFYQRSGWACLDLELKSAGFGVQPPDLAASAAAKAVEARQRSWGDQLPNDLAELWATLVAFDGDSRAALFAHCVSFGVNAVHEPWNRNPQRFAHADTLARAVGLDMAAAGWVPTVDAYLGRVPKARILEAVREARGPEAAQLIDHLRKPDMAKEAERLLAGSGWLPEPLRLPMDASVEGDADAEGDGEALPAFLTGDDEASNPGSDVGHAEAAAVAA